MPESPPPASPLATPYKGPHYALIQQRIPDWLTAAVPARISLFNSTTLSRPDWYASASPDQHATLQLANAEVWRAQNAVDQHLRDVQDI